MIIPLFFCSSQLSTAQAGFLTGFLLASPGAAADCTALYHTGVQDSGVYTIQPNGSEAFSVYCEMKFGKSCASTSLSFTEISPSKPNNFVSSQITQKLGIYGSSWLLLVVCLLWAQVSHILKSPYHCSHSSLPSCLYWGNDIQSCDIN